MRRSALGPTAATATGVVQQGASDVALETNATTAIRCIAARRTGATATCGLSHVVAGTASIALSRRTSSTRMRSGVTQARTTTT